MLYLRRSSHSVILAIALLTVALSSVACQKAPQTEIDAARAALQEVANAPAAVYAEEEVAIAREALAAVDAEVQTQAERFALTRSYDQTMELIHDAQARTKEARAAAIERREQAKTEAEQAMQSIHSSLETAQTMLAELTTCPKKPKGFTNDLEQMKAQLDAVSPELTTIEQALGSEDYRGVTARATTVSEQLGQLVADLSGAKTKLRC